MDAFTPSIFDTRRPQMFPTLEPAEIERVRRFGECCSYAAGEALVTAGTVARGLTIILSGHVRHQPARRRRAPHADRHPTARPFMGELAQLAGRPALVDAYAQERGRGPVIAPDRLRALLVAEAELGERIMRALILRRVGLIETGAGGPVIVGRPDNGDVLRLQGFLRAQRPSAPDARSRDRRRKPSALIERFHVDPAQLPIVLCPAASCCAIRARSSWPAASAWSGRSIPTASTTSRSSAPGRPGSRGRLCGLRRAFGAGARLPRVRRPGRRLGADRELSGLPDRHQRHGADGPRLQPGPEVRGRDGDPGRGHVALAAARPTRAVRARRWSTTRAVRARAVVIACGARYRRLDGRGTSTQFEGSSVHYWASPLEGKLCAGQEVALVGAGNSAGQAVGLSREPGREGLAAGARRRPRRRACRAISSTASPACRTSRW